MLILGIKRLHFCFFYRKLLTLINPHTVKVMRIGLNVMIFLLKESETIHGQTVLNGGCMKVVRDQPNQSYEINKCPRTAAKDNVKMRCRVKILSNSFVN